MGPDLSATDDVALVHLVARGDEAAMGEIYRRHGRGVYGLARRVLGDDAVAEEVLQDVFVRLWQRPERFDPARGHLKGYLLREGHGRAVDRLRSDTRPPGAGGRATRWRRSASSGPPTSSARCGT